MYRRTFALILALLAAYFTWLSVGAGPGRTLVQAPELAPFKIVGLREALHAGLAPEGAGLGDGAARPLAPPAVFALVPDFVPHTAWTGPRERTK